MKATQKLKEWGYPDVAIQYISKDKSENKEFRLFVAPISDKPAAEKAFQVLDKKIKFKIQLMELADIP
jgi:hypothetical protein